MKMIQCKLAFSLVDSAGLCLRGARSALHRPAKLNLNDAPIDMIVSEGWLPLASFLLSMTSARMNTLIYVTSCVKCVVKILLA